MHSIQQRGDPERAVGRCAGLDECGLKDGDKCYVETSLRFFTQEEPPLRPQKREMSSGITLKCQSTNPIGYPTPYEPGWRRNCCYVFNLIPFTEENYDPKGPALYH